jgi:hypothetical protein
MTKDITSLCTETRDMSVIIVLLFWLIRTNYERGFSFRYLYKKKIVKKINYFDIAHVNIFHQSLFNFLHSFTIVYGEINW